MKKKEFFLQNYLEFIDLEQNNSSVNNSEFKILLEETNQEFQQITSYPFNKKELIKYIQSPEFLVSANLSPQLNTLKKKLDNFEIKQILDHLSDSKKTEEIEFEKRRRYQAYKVLDYNLSFLTYFDFFSHDLFQIAKMSKYLAKIYGQKKVSLSFLFLSCLNFDFASGKFLQKFGFHDKFVANFSTQFKPKGFLLNLLSNLAFFNSFNYWQKTKTEPFKLKKIIEFSKIISNDFFKKFKNLVNIFEKEENFFDQTISHDFEVNQIYEKIAINALERFKTPIITPEIFLITLIENKNFKLTKILRKIVPDDTKWYLLRYKFLKQLYNQEINVRTQVPRSQHFFAYLLKTQILDSHFELLIEKKLLAKAVYLFRNVLISELLQNDFVENFEDETYLSIFISPSRNYS